MKTLGAAIRLATYRGVGERAIDLMLNSIMMNMGIYGPGTLEHKVDLIERYAKMHPEHQPLLDSLTHDLTEASDATKSWVIVRDITHKLVALVDLTCEAHRLADRAGADDPTTEACKLAYEAEDKVSEVAEYLFQSIESAKENNLTQTEILKEMVNVS